MTDPPRFKLLLVPVASDDRPVAVRLRWLLKTALRQCGLRALSVEQLAPPPDSSGQPKKGSAGVAPPPGHHEH